MAADETPEPVLRVVKGEPSAEELAALVAVVASLRTPAAAPTRRTPEWNANRRLQRVMLRAGQGAWRTSSLPR
ncbi:MAG: acyl-CoA carboxylase subunit epsilon [Nocardioides sp.]